MKPRLLSGLLLASVSLLMTLLALEVALRLFGSGHTPYRKTRIEGVPSGSKTQPHFRQPGYQLPPRSDAFRILVVGDSFTWGHGVYPEDAYPHRLETRLNSVSKGEVFEVINWSRSGWNTLLEKRSLEGRLGELAPDLLILSFTLNDAEPESLSELGALRTDLVRREPGSAPSAWLVERSRLYSLVWNRLEYTRQRRAFNTYYNSLFEGPHWQTCRRALRRIRTMARNHEIPLLMIVFPIFDSQLDESYAYRDLHQKMQAFGESLRIPVFDLLEVYEGIDAHRLAVVPFTDAHPNELGHRLAADAILDYLVRGRLIPPVDHQPKQR